MGADESNGLVGHRGVVDAQDDVTLLESGFCGWTSLVWFVDDHSRQGCVIAYHGSYAYVSSGEHLLQFVHFALGIVFGIGVERIEHCIDAIAYHLVGIQCVNIYHVEVAIDVAEHFDVLRHGEVMVFVVLRLNSDGENRQQDGG